MAKLSQMMIICFATFYIPYVMIAMVTTHYMNFQETNMVTMLFYVGGATTFYNGTGNAIIFLVFNRKAKAWFRRLVGIERRQGNVNAIAPPVEQQKITIVVRLEKKQDVAGEGVAFQPDA